jgi:hypothetical protein
MGREWLCGEYLSLLPDIGLDVSVNINGWKLPTHPLPHQLFPVRKSGPVVSLMQVLPDRI